MGDEKIEQNIERVNIYLFNTLGLSKSDAVRVIKGVFKKRDISLEKLKE